MNNTLFVGDSHSVLSFGDRFREEFNHHYQQQKNLFQYAASGSRLPGWLSGDLKTHRLRNLISLPGEEPHKAGFEMNQSILQLLQNHQCHEMIIALGTNDLRALHSKEYELSNYLQQIAELRKILVKTTWILPPRLPETVCSLDLQKAYLQAVQTQFSRIHFVDSQWITPDQEDGIHFLQERAWTWGEVSFRSYLAGL